MICRSNILAGTSVRPITNDKVKKQQMILSNLIETKKCISPDIVEHNSYFGVISNKSNNYKSNEL